MKLTDLINLKLQGKTFEKITFSELVAKLKLIDGKSHTGISFTSITVATKMRKTGNPYRDELVEKLCWTHGNINMNYENVVNNKLEREGKERNFVASENWGEAKYDMFNGCIGQKKDSNSTQLYLRYIPLSTEFMSYGINGNVCEPEQSKIIASFMPPYKPATNQGTETEVPYRMYKLEGIKLIKLNKVLYQIV